MLGTGFYEYPWCNDSDILVFLFFRINVQIGLWPSTMILLNKCFFSFFKVCCKIVFGAEISTLNRRWWWGHSWMRNICFGFEKLLQSCEDYQQTQIKTWSRQPIPSKSIYLSWMTSMINWCINIYIYFFGKIYFCIYSWQKQWKLERKVWEREDRTCSKRSRSGIEPGSLA